MSTSSSFITAISLPILKILVPFQFLMDFRGVMAKNLCFLDTLYIQVEVTVSGYRNTTAMALWPDCQTSKQEDTGTPADTSPKIGSW